MKLKTLFYVFFISTTSLIICEISMRIMGVQPGMIENYDGFEYVDSLYTYENYTTDSYGIYKFSNLSTDSIPKHLSNNGRSIKNSYLKDKINWETDYLNVVYSDFKKLKHKVNQENYKPESELETMIKSIQSPNLLEKKIMTYIDKPFNEEGFRSIAFDSSKINKVKVLLIGDSFVYGQSAKPFYNSFYDILLARGFEVYNAGISGTDLAQYKAIVSKYSKELKPDLIIVNFCVQNDIVSFYRTPKEGEPYEYVTNAGYFYNFSKGEHQSVEDTYQFYKEISSVPKNSFLNKLASKFAIGTKIWAILHQKGWVTHHELNNYLSFKNPKSKKRIDYTLAHLNDIQKISDSSNVKTIFCLIPDKNKINSTTKFKGNKPVPSPMIYKIFKEFDYRYPINFTLDDFPKNQDIHFNNTGSLKYANFLEEIITNSTQTNEF